MAEFEQEHIGSVAVGDSKDADDYFAFDAAAKIIDPQAFSKFDAGDGFDKLQVINRMNAARQKAREIAALARPAQEPVAYTTLAELAQVRSGYYGRMQDDANDFGWNTPLYAAPQPAGEPVVKALGWESGNAVHRAHMEFGYYRIESSCSEPLKYWLEHSTDNMWEIYNKDRFTHSSLDEAKAAAQADYEQRILSAIAAPQPVINPTHSQVAGTPGLLTDPAPADHANVDPAMIGIAEEMQESGGHWQPCSGCYDTEDGHPTQKYDFSPALQTAIGCGCHECGGLGAVWWHMTDEKVSSFAEDMEAIDDDAIDAIQRMMDKRGLTRKDVFPAKSRASECMSRKRPLSIAMIRKLHFEHGVPAEVLIAPYRIVTEGSANEV